MNVSVGAAVTPEGVILEAARAVSIADSEESVKEAQEALLASLGQAATDEIPGTPESTANKAARDMALSASRVAVLEAQESLEEAQDVKEILRDASDALTSRQRDLINSRAEFDAARLAYTSALPTDRAPGAFGISPVQAGGSEPFVAVLPTCWVRPRRPGPDSYDGSPIPEDALLGLQTDERVAEKPEAQH